MEAVRLHKFVEKDGEIVVTDLPCKKGQLVEVIVLLEPMRRKKSSSLTAKELRNSELVGLWKDREDVEDSATYARQLREQAQKRQR